MTITDALFAMLGVVLIGCALGQIWFKMKSFSEIGLHNRARRKALKATPLRKITEQERELLTPYMHSKRLVELYSYPPKLKKDDVYNITGDYLLKRDVLGNRYHSIANIQVVFPYGIKEAILEDNNCVEVIFTYDYAFVLRLNDIHISKYQMQYYHNENVDEGL